MEIRTSLPRLHRLCTPDSSYGGAAQQRLRQQLDTLRDTPVVFDDIETKRRRTHRFIHSWRQTSRGEVFVGLHWRWSEPFADESKTQLKPFLFTEYRAIPGDINKLLYVHFDYALSNYSKAELKHSTILQRVGSFHESNSTAETLQRYASHQRWRLREAWQLNGRLLSNGQRLNLCEAKAQKPTQRDVSEYKFVATATNEQDGTKKSAPPELAPVLSLDYYRTRKERWLQRPAAVRHTTRVMRV
jgi:hypothetical protein